MSPASLDLAFTGAGWLAEELIAAGVRHACISPGSRSTALALALSDRPDMRTWVLYDERSAAYFALGLARARSEPVALLCTSGTAVANYLPGVVEASLSRVPLILLTADRPPEARDVGAAQTIDQVGVFGSAVRYSIDLPVVDTAPQTLRHWRSTLCRAVAIARATPAGPVHLNIPFREPLVASASPDVKIERPEPGEDRPAPFSRALIGRRTLPEAEATEVAEMLERAERPLLVAGPMEDRRAADALLDLARRCDIPIVADPLSGLRDRDSDARIVDSADVFLRDLTVCRALEPDLILRVGAPPTSRPVFEYLDRARTSTHLLVDDGAAWRDATLVGATHIWADPADVLTRISGRGVCGRDWTVRWRRVASAARQALDSALTGIDEPFEGRAFRELAEVLPEGSSLFVGNSMPVRDLDAFYPALGRGVRLLGNRGAAGIDGVVSTAVGLAAAGDGPVFLAIGDMSFYHDMNGLLVARMEGIPLNVILLNNDGGGIFSFLSQASLPRHFERLFGTPHGLDFARVAHLYDMGYERPPDWAAFRRAVASCATARERRIIEVTSTRERNAELHRQVWAEGVKAAREALGR